MKAPSSLYQRWIAQAHERPLPAACLDLLVGDNPVAVIGSHPDTVNRFSSLLRGLGLRTVALEQVSIQGIVYLPGLELNDVGTLEPERFDLDYRRTVWPLLSAVQASREALEANSGWIVVLTRMGGTHGAPPFPGTQAPGDGFHPLCGALTGLAKTIGKELPKLRVRLIDFEPGDQLEDIAKIVVAEIRSNDGRTEIGWSGGKRWAIRLRPKDLPVGLPGLSGRDLNSKSVVVITGGGQGIGAECAKEIAKRYRSRLVIIGRTPLGSKPASKKAESLRRNLERMKEFGSKVDYLASDIGDERSLQRGLRGLEEPLGAADIILHAAGLYAPGSLLSKTTEQFDGVFRAKAHGAVHLLKHIPPKPGQTWVFFSSTAGRFGAAGYGDYAAANGFLAKLAAWLRRQGRSAVALHLTAFSGVGMVREEWRHRFLKAQGMDSMPPSIGIPMILQEALRVPPEHEVMLAGAVGLMDSERLMEPRP